MKPRDNSTRGRWSISRLVRRIVERYDPARVKQLMNRRAFVAGLGAVLVAPLAAEIHHEADALVQTPRRSALLTRRLWFARGKGYVKT